MSEYSIHVSNGKVVGDSVFYLLANQALSKECKKLCDFTDALDQATAQKKERIAEYKCAKYRYAAISNVQVRLQQSHRLRDRLADTHYVLAAVDEILCRRQDLLSRYEASAESDKPDMGLFCGMIALADDFIADCEGKMGDAQDWEAVELTERLGGYRYARECLIDAWEDGR